jgi:hypothetical protein
MTGITATTTQVYQVAPDVSGARWMLVLSGLKTLLETGEPMA